MSYNKKNHYAFEEEPTTKRDKGKFSQVQPKKTKRNISDRLRFKILMRYGFTCKSCGASATNQFGTELHVDHIIPWSKGGEIAEALKKTDIVCNAERLLHDTEPGIFLNTNQQDPTVTSSFSAQINNINWSVESTIQKEIEVFQQLSPNAIITMVTDNSMMPFYNIGDYVGGIFQDKNNFKTFIGQNCIITVENNPYIRRLYESKVPQHYNVGAINPETDVSEPTMYNVNIEALAPIIWHRRNDPQMY